MTERQQIIAAIQEGTAQVQRTFGPLTDEQLQTQIHHEEGGWTAGQVLAHLAARQPVNDRIFRQAAGESEPPVSAAGVGDWNQQLVDGLSGQSKEALLAEFQAVQERLIARVEALSDERLAQPFPLPQGEMPLGTLLGLAGGSHAAEHARAVEEVLAGSGTQQ